MAAERFRPEVVLATLARHRVDFVLIGGMAGIAHGSALPSFDVDVAYERSDENLERLAAALHELDAELRGAPRDLPFRPDAEILRAGMHFTFETPYGSFDIVADPDGAPSYPHLVRAASEAEVAGERVRLVSIDHLIAMKEATGRPKDKAMAAELRAISDELRAGERPNG
ncbi:MAG: hypothetical protein ICV59_04715 [Thermoleophilia bacterium]|nr:hypothetical protein [Thermoleophilia bacterium]